MALLTTVLAACGLVGYALYQYWRSKNRLDLLFGLSVLSWSIWLALLFAVEQGWLARDSIHLARVLYQATIFGGSAFLLQALNALHWPQTALVIAQAVAGVFFALASLVEWIFPLDPMIGWSEVNIVFAVLLLLRIAQVAWRLSTNDAWMVLLVSILGMSIMQADVRASDLLVAWTSSAHNFYAAAMLLLWLILTRRVDTLRLATSHPPDDLELERKRLAQELHDGVGSELVSIIATLDAGTPQQRATAASLQHCLLELKLLVDVTANEGSVVEHLASLRYRLQPLLQSAGVKMRWDMRDEDVLEHARGELAKQVLRIAQEALANVLIHSHADEVVVTCWYEKAKRALILEVVDNGTGLPPDMHADRCPMPSSEMRGGKGLPGMSWRARKVGGHLVVGTAPGGGTRVTLQIPMRSTLKRHERE